MTLSNNPLVNLLLACHHSHFRYHHFLESIISNLPGPPLGRLMSPPSGLLIVVIFSSALRPETPLLCANVRAGQEEEPPAQLRVGGAEEMCGMRRRAHQGRVLARLTWQTWQSTFLMALATMPYCMSGSHSGHLGTLTLSERIPSSTRDREHSAELTVPT